MARFYEIAVRGEVSTEDVVNVFWYRQEGVGLATDADLQALYTAFNANVLGPYLAAKTNGYQMRSTTIQGYSDQWARAPYLPLIQDEVRLGTIVTAGAPAIVCAVLGLRVEPKVDGLQPIPGGAGNRLRPVRRGYLAISPLPTTVVGESGQFIPWADSTGIWANLRAAAQLSFTPAGWADPAVPVRVSNPPKNVTTRGYGLIRGAAWREALSSRRSRKRGLGV